ncbi:MAG: circadian clock KaiB family protein [Verrucomicrobiota bacterium]|nr:circadian clock KaiB family protein [Verrucomicrobiota bacterium]
MKTLSKPRGRKAPAPPKWNLRLYVADGGSKSIAALRNLTELCDEHLAGRYSIEVIDLHKNPELAQGDQIMALPAVVRKLPVPIRKIIGTLADTERVLVGLDLRPHELMPFPASLTGKAAKRVG